MQTIAKSIAALALVMLSGCAHELNEKITTEQMDLQIRAERAQAIARKRQINSPYLTEQSSPKFTTRSTPFEREDTLPSHLGKITMRVPGRHSLGAIGEMIERLIDIPVLVSPDALIDVSLFTPGALAPVIPSTDKPSEAMLTNEEVKQRSVKAGAKTVIFTDRELRNTFELNYSGSVAGLLDYIATRAGLQWQYQGGRITFKRLVTRAISVKALSGGVKSSGSVTIGSGIAASTSAENDIWPMLEATLKNMVSPRGRMQVDSKSGMVVVTDALQNVDAIARFIELQNSTMLRQIVLDVEVLQIDLTQEHASGIDWSVVGNGLASTNSISASGSSVLQPFTGVGNPGTIQSVVNRGDGGNVKALITALEQFGRVSTSYSTVVVTTNRQPVPLGVQNSEAYLASVTAGTANATTGISTGPTLTASTVSTGFSMVLVPLIMDSNRVLIESTVQVSALREMKNFSSGSGNSINSIQLPSVDSYNTLQRVSVAAGDTIVMSGFEREVLLNDATDVVRDLVPGSRRGKSTKQSTVILVTPRLQK